MIWEQYFLTRAALVIYSMAAAMFWTVVGLDGGLGRSSFAVISLLPAFHSWGMVCICAGMFGQRKWALFVTLIVGLLWFAPAGIIVFNTQTFHDVARGNLGAIALLLGMTCSGLALFFITWLLVRNSRQVPDHFREF